VNKIISIIIVTYNSELYIRDCIRSIEKQECPSGFSHEIIIVDNCSSDSTASIIREEFAHLLLIINDKNRGYGQANNVGVKHSKGEYIIIVNPDTIAEDYWLIELIEPIVLNCHLLTTSKILNYDGSSINTAGNIIHFTGLAFTRGYGLNRDAYSEREIVAEVSGCSFALRKEDFFQLGGFDENIFLYHDDVDISCKAHLNGFKILYVPTSIIRHSYRLNVPPIKLYYLEKGRYFIIKKFFTSHYVFLLIPSFFLVEILTFFYSLRLGKEGLKYKCLALIEGLTMDVSQYDIKDKNKRRNLLDHFSINIPIDQLTYNSLDKYIKVISNKIFELNFRVMR